MRALIIGIGGAGCRIVELLNRHDRDSSVHSVRSYIFDADSEILRAKSSIPMECRIKLSPYNLSTNEHQRGTDFEITSLPTVFQDEAVDEVDAIFVCAGLGGRMAEAVPGIIKQLNEAFADPVFTILTLPARSEGARISARAAETLEEIRKVCSASILFDNEIWMQRLEEQRAAETAEKLDAEGNPEPVARNALKYPIREAYSELNDLLVRRVELLLRAGEVAERGLETAEAVLDAGEVLNTLTGTDIVAIGYATERLPSNMLGFLKRLTVEKYMLDEGHERTARIVELAKRAVYEQVSIPCDLTSADKALVLITGPSNELSMKGFQTVRKWIDRSIKGLEMRAGDYPVRSERSVGVIVVLAGIENVPRIAELNDIRESYQDEIRKIYRGEEEEEAKKPQKTVVEDDDIFEAEAASLMSGNLLGDGGIDVIGADEEFWSEPLSEAPKEEEVVTDIKDEVTDDDFFEEKPREIPKKEEPAPVEYQPMVQEEYPSDEEVQEDFGTQEKSLEEVLAGIPSSDKKRDKQISMGGAKKAKKLEDTVIALPKREKHEDMVLNGMANIGAKDRAKETDEIVRIGDAKRPKEVESAVQVGGMPRPKDDDAMVSVGGKMRPKDDESAINAGSRQRPNDGDGTIRVAAVKRPRELGTRIDISKAQMPKDIWGTVRVARSQKPKEIGETIRIAEQKKPDKEAPVHIADKAKPVKDAPVHIGGKAKTTKETPDKRDMKWV